MDFPINPGKKSLSAEDLAPQYHHPAVERLLRFWRGKSLGSLQLAPAAKDWDTVPRLLGDKCFDWELVDIVCVLSNIG